MLEWVISTLQISAVTELVPELIWAPELFGPQEIWSLRNLDPEKFWPLMKKPCDGFHAGTKFIGAHISWGPNFLGPKFHGAQIRLGTISVRVAP